MQATFKWQLYITLSALSFIAFGISETIAFCLLFPVKQISFNASQTTTLKGFIIYYHVPCGIGIAVLGLIALAFLPHLTKKRQEARDAAEYDEDGISYKHNNFSALSKKERDAIERQLMLDRQRILPTTLLKSITKQGVSNATDALNELIALDSVKNEVQKLEARMKYELNKTTLKKGGTIKHESMNMIFKGNPGTGKTTIARIVTGLLFENRFIAKNQLIEVDGNFFNGLSKGESSKRADMLIKAARGGVLFIDEAYVLLSSGGQEVIATIVKAMEEERDSIVFIFAGYTRKMNMFLNSNPGIESRIKYQFDFNDYNEEELKQIFTLMANSKELYVTYEVLNRATEELLKEKRNNPNFGNARAVRTCLDKIIDNHALNLANGLLSKNDLYTLRECDLKRGNL